MMYFCFLAKIVSFQKVAQNLSSRLKTAIESHTQQHTMSQFSSLKEEGVMYTKLVLELSVGIFVPVEYQLHMTVCPKHRERTVFAGELAVHKTAASVGDRI